MFPYFLIILLDLCVGKVLFPERNILNLKNLTAQVVQQTGVGGKIKMQLIGIQRLPGLVVAAVYIAATVFTVT